VFPYWEAGSEERERS